MKHLLLLVAICLALSACSSSGNSSTEDTTTQSSASETLDKGGRWLMALFQSSEREGFFLPYDEAVFTPRLHQFFEESYMLYDTRSNDMSDAELEEAKELYKKKWEGIYPIKEDAMGFFGAGYDDLEIVENVKVVPLGELRYNVILEYEWRGAIQSTVRLVEQGEGFVIDEMSCKRIPSEPVPMLLHPGKRCFTNSDEGKDITNIEMDIASDGTVKGLFKVVPADGEGWDASFSGKVIGNKLRVEFDLYPLDICEGYYWELRRKWSVITCDLGNGEESEVLIINFYGPDPETGDPGSIPFSYIECSRKNAAK